MFLKINANFEKGLSKVKIGLNGGCSGGGGRIGGHTSTGGPRTPKIFATYLIYKYPIFVCNFMEIFQNLSLR